ADSSEEEAQIVGDLRDRPDRGARALRERALLDRDRGREALDRLDRRLRELLEELSRVGAEALDVAALAFRVDRVEREGGFSRAARPGDHHQLVPGDRAADVLE